MRNYGPKKRTRTNRETDLILFVGMATDAAYAKETPETLARRYGVSEAFARGVMGRRGPLL